MMLGRCVARLCSDSCLSGDNLMRLEERDSSSCWDGLQSHSVQHLLLWFLAEAGVV